MKGKNELRKRQRKKHFINRWKYTEKNILRLRIDVFKIYEGDDFNENFNVLSRLKSRNRNI